MILETAKKIAVSDRPGLTDIQVSALVAGFGFTLCHVDPKQLIPIGFVAAILCTLRAVSGSLLPGIAAHMGFNAVAVVAVLSGWGSEATAPSVNAQVLVTGLLVVLVFVYVRYVGAHPAARASRQEEMLQPDPQDEEDEDGY